MRCIYNKDQQAQRLTAWYAKYICNAATANDRMTGRSLILPAHADDFRTVFNNQVALAEQGYLSGRFLIRCTVELSEPPAQPSFIHCLINQPPFPRHSWPIHMLTHDAALCTACRP
jgi:hypothetical protein